MVVRAVGLPVPGASVDGRDVVSNDTASAVTAFDGTARLRLGDGSWLIRVTRMGLRSDSVSMTVSADTTITIEMVPSSVATLAPVVVGTSRVSRRLQDEPERVEILAGEDVDEKTVMRPSDPTRLLSEMPGVRVQTTSAGLGGAGLRLRGLRGRYTLVLSDGLPLYGSAQGIGFMDIPPLDLEQAEVIKGAAAALYGPEALGGVVNLISRPPPRDARTTDVVANATSRNGQDLSAWNGGRVNQKWGYTFLGGAHRQSAKDLNGDGWSDIPSYDRGEGRVRFVRADSTRGNAMITAGASHENRTGGSFGGSLLPSGRAYVVGARTTHADVGGQGKFPIGSTSDVTVRASVGAQWQDRQFGDSSESDRRSNSLVEAVYSSSLPRRVIVVGIAGSASGLSGNDVPLARYSFTTGSVFSQETYNPVGFLAVSGTARLDRNSRYGTSFSPRVSALARLGLGWTLRAAAGVATSNPTPLVEEADVVGLRRVRGFAAIRSESLRDVSADLNGRVGPAELNVSAFTSLLSRPVGVIENEPFQGAILLINAPQTSRVKGAEMFAVYSREPMAVTALYSVTDATEWSFSDGRRVRSSLVPRQAGGVDIAFEEDESGTRVGLEVFYTGRQSLEHDPYRNESAPYATVGILAEQRIGKATIFLNADDITDVRQTRFDPLLLPRQAPTGRWTTDVWAPLDGRIINVGARLRF